MARTGRPRKSRDTEALNRVSQARAELEEANEMADRARERYESEVVKALQDSGLRTVADVAGVTVSAIQKVRDKQRVATSGKPRHT